ncbi:MAG: biotin transporter BioY [Acidihalobacter sp.]|uniref:biotin transporter BioY n=1 Tax=Acidihalobacter sp. TaxID=1872108 RepID=UPI00307E2F4F
MSSLALETQDTLVTRLWPEANASRALRNAALVAIGSLLLAAASQVTVPLWPVPVSGQTFAVLLIGMAYGARLGMVTVLTYLFEGAIGLPFFAGGAAGLAPLIGPTGGYLAGFVLAAGVIGWLAQHGWGRNGASTAVAMLIGNIALYVPGLLWLSAFMHFNVHATLAAGLVPFMLGDLAKLLLATALMPLAWRLLGKAGR